MLLRLVIVNVHQFGKLHVAFLWESSELSPMQWMYVTRCQVSGGLNFSITAPAVSPYAQSVCSRTTDHHDNLSLWKLTCRGLWDDGGPGQFGSGEQHVVTLLPQFEDPTQDNTLTDTHEHTQLFQEHAVY